MRSRDACFDSIPHATGTLTRLACAYVQAKGLDPRPLLKKANLTLHQIQDANHRLSVSNQIKFLNLAAAELGDPLLGFHLAHHPTDLRELGFLYYVAASSELLGDALQRLARYASIVNEGIALKYIGGKYCGIAFRYVGISRHSDCHQIECFVTVAVRLCRQLTGIRLVPTHVKLAHRRDGRCSEMSEFFGGEIEFGAAVDEVLFAPGIHDRPIVSADHYLNKLLISYFEEALARRPAKQTPFRSSVENAIAPLLPHGQARVDEISRRLGVSQRTLARRLSSERMNFSSVLDNLKRDLAERYLADDALSISQVAWLLGYHEVSSFTHAFKRWTHKTPRQMRTQKAA